MKKINAGLLLEKYKSGTISDEELEMLESWYLHEIKSNKSYEGLEENLTMLDKHFLSTYQPETQRKKYLWKRMVAAAVVLIALSAGFLLYKSRYTDINVIPKLASTEIKPGKNSATLTLSNGKKIKLTAALTGKLAEESGVKITKTADGQILYEIQPSETENIHNQKPTTNTLSTANGESYKIRLPDGSLVVLNAASSLTYATNLNTLDVRRVMLNGEAYFEISKDKSHPFVVETATHEVKVLGTHFNISSYTNEPAAKTTLIEGSVKVSSNYTDKKNVILIPGQQATMTSTGSLLVKKVDTEEVLAWKNGYFLFNDEEIGSILRKVGRWYNVEIEYESGAITERFNGMISREKSLSQVLAMLQKTDVVKFRTEGRRIIVK